MSPPGPRKRLQKRVLLGLAALAVALWLGSSAFAAWRLTRRLRPRFPEPAPLLEGAAKVEEHRIRTRDGEEIGAWLMRGEASKPCVVLLHGNNDSRTSRTQVLERLARRGDGVLAVSLRAHGDSTGAVNDFGWSAREDVIASVSFLEKELPGRKIVVFGQSLGAAAAIFAAGELGTRVQGYVLETPYSDLKTAVRNRTETYLPPLLDRVAYAGLLLWSDAFLPVAAQKISPLEHVADIPATVPIVFLAGTADRHARLSEVQAMQSRVAAHAKLVAIEGAEHSKLFETNPQLYEKSIVDLIEAR
jgi:alpha-beta hydrolase superfamily lysophospholipase